MIKRLKVYANVAFEEGQPVAVYWGENEDGEHEFYAGTIKGVSDDEIMVAMNFGDTEVVDKKDFRSLVILKKPLFGKNTYTKQQVAKERLLMPKPQVSQDEGKAAYLAQYANRPLSIAQELYEDDSVNREIYWKKGQYFGSTGMQAKGFDTLDKAVKWLEKTSGDVKFDIEANKHYDVTIPEDIYKNAGIDVDWLKGKPVAKNMGQPKVGKNSSEKKSTDVGEFFKQLNQLYGIEKYRKNINEFITGLQRIRQKGGVDKTEFNKMLDKHGVPEKPFGSVIWGNLDLLPIPPVEKTDTTSLEGIAKTIALSMQEEFGYKDESYWGDVVARPLENDSVSKLANSILNKDVDTLLTRIANQPNDVNKGVQKAFTSITGIEILGLDPKKKQQAIFNYAGMNAKAVKDYLENVKVKKAAADTQREKDQAERAIENLDNWAKTQEIVSKGGKSESIENYVKRYLAAGYTEFVAGKKEGIDQYTLVNRQTGKGILLTGKNMIAYAQLMVKRLNEVPTSKEEPVKRSEDLEKDYHVNPIFRNMTVEQIEKYLVDQKKRVEKLSKQGQGQMSWSGNRSTQKAVSQHAAERFSADIFDLESYLKARKQLEQSGKLTPPDTLALFQPETLAGILKPVIGSSVVKDDQGFATKNSKYYAFTQTGYISESTIPRVIKQSSDYLKSVGLKLGRPGKPLEKGEYSFFIEGEDSDDETGEMIGTLMLTIGV